MGAGVTVDCSLQINAEAPSDSKMSSHLIESSSGIPPEKQSSNTHSADALMEVGLGRNHQEKDWRIANSRRAQRSQGLP